MIAGGADIAFYVGDCRSAYMKTNVCATRARWIPAFAGMTIVSEGVSFQMTPLPAPPHTCHSTNVSDTTRGRFPICMFRMTNPRVSQQTARKEIWFKSIPTSAEEAM